LLVSRAAPSTAALGGPLCPPQTSSGVQPQVDSGLAAARKMLDERRLEGAWKRIIKTSNLVTLHDSSPIK